MDETKISVGEGQHEVRISSSGGCVNLAIGAAQINLPDDMPLKLEARNVRVTTAETPTLSVDGGVRAKFGMIHLDLPADVNLTFERPAKPARKPEPGSA